MNRLHESLHNLEHQLIELDALTKTIEKLVSDEDMKLCTAIMCLLDLQREQLELFKKNFYHHWKMLYPPR